MKRLLIVAIACALSPVATAQLYKYTDKDGKTVYTDQPPPTADPKQLNIRSAATPGSVPAKSALERQKDETKARAKGADEAKKADAKSKEAAAKAERCEQAKQSYRTYTDGGRLQKYNAQGERVFMEESEMEAEREKARRVMDEACKA
jgi:hypothetical protein